MYFPILLPRIFQPKKYSTIAHTNMISGIGLWIIAFEMPLKRAVFPAKTGRFVNLLNSNFYLLSFSAHYHREYSF
jgi:hypothetical protein